MRWSWYNARSTNCYMIITVSRSEWLWRGKRSSWTSDSWNEVTSKDVQLVSWPGHTGPGVQEEERGGCTLTNGRRDRTSRRLCLYFLIYLEQSEQLRTPHVIWVKWNSAWYNGDLRTFNNLTTSLCCQCHSKHRPQAPTLDNTAQQRHHSLKLLCLSQKVSLHFCHNEESKWTIVTRRRMFIYRPRTWTS